MTPPPTNAAAEFDQNKAELNRLYWLCWEAYAAIDLWMCGASCTEAEERLYRRLKEAAQPRSYPAPQP